mmetsp:Transcript_89465/g.186923  ORF Transcript_89465/g.186923 Transcript_89465/m.186923 type:complete len:236 (+) Transcript_89465:327-1034(+)
MASLLSWLCCRNEEVSVLSDSHLSSKTIARAHCCLDSKTDADGFAPSIPSWEGSGPDWLQGFQPQKSRDRVSEVSSTRAGSQISESSSLVTDALSTFVRTLLRGIIVEILLDDGTVLTPRASLNYGMTELFLSLQDIQQVIMLEDVENIVTPSQLEDRQRCLLGGVRDHLDDRCCTLFLSTTEFVTFRFDNERHREYFATCLSLLIARAQPGVGDRPIRTSRISINSDSSSVLFD